MSTLKEIQDKNITLIKKGSPMVPIWLDWETDEDGNVRCTDVLWIQHNRDGSLYLIRNDKEEYILRNKKDIDKFIGKIYNAINEINKLI